MAELAESTLLPTPPEYDAELASELMMGACGGAYIAGAVDSKDRDELVFVARTDGTDGTEVTASINRKVNEMSIIFRGSANLGDWLTDFSILAVDVDSAVDNANIRTEVHGSDVYGASYYTTRFAALGTLLKYNMSRLIGREYAVAHRGFVDRAIKYSRWVEDCAREAYPDEGMQKIQRLRVTGHSLGGGAASTMAYWCAGAYPHIAVQCYTFEAPLVGNYAFQRAFIERVPHSFAHRISGDIVSSVPPWFYAGARYRITYLPTMGGLAKLLWPSPLDIHSAPYRCFIPWIRRVYPVSYENTFSNVASKYELKKSPYDPRAPSNKSIAVTMPYFVPGFAGDDESQAHLEYGVEFKSRWIDRAAHPYPWWARLALNLLNTLVSVAIFVGIYLLGRSVWDLFGSRLLGALQETWAAFTSGMYIERGYLMVGVAVPAGTLLAATLISGLVARIVDDGDHSVWFDDKKAAGAPPYAA